MKIEFEKMLDGALSSVSQRMDDCMARRDEFTMQGEVGRVVRSNVELSFLTTQWTALQASDSFRRRDLATFAESALVTILGTPVHLVGFPLVGFCEVLHHKVVRMIDI